jgi:serine phosphatase RsbU (regulator of sigma subunit)
MTSPHSSGRQKQSMSPGRKPTVPPGARRATEPPVAARKTGEHPALPAGPRSPGRTASSDRQATKPAPRGRGQRPRMALRLKFMLVMAGVTALAMVVLGLSMGSTANRYLYGQKTLDGLEIANMAAQIATMAKDRVDMAMAHAKATNDNSGLQTLQRDLRAYLNDRLTRVKEFGGNLSDIEGVLINCPEIPELSAAGLGADQGTGKGDQLTRLFVPKLSNHVAVPEGVTIYEGVKATAAGQVRILRFKLDLPSDPPPRGFGKVVTNGVAEPANIRVDIALASVDKVRSNLATTIAIAVLLAIVVVLGIAQWLAISITKPLETLLKDMNIVSQGKLHHRTAAKSSDEIGILASEFNRMTESLQDAQAAVIEQEKQAYELSLAREVQQQLLPAQAPLITGWQCSSFYQGAKAVSGDYFDFIPLGNGLWGFIIADVSGKGIPGSMVMAVTRTVVRLVAPRHGAHADETLKDTNRLIAKQIKRGMFVTSFYAVLDERSGLLTYASAGHNPMVIYRAATRTTEQVATKGIALGFNEGPVFDRTIQIAQATLGKGDSFVLYTDGFPEAMNASNEEFGDDNFYKLIATNGHLESQALIESVVAGIARHRGNAEQSDDLTIVAVRRA